MYWRIGRTILERLAVEDYGTAVIARLSDDLRDAFPGSRGFSPRNLRYMRTFAQAWPAEVWQQPAAKLPWGHIMVLLDKLEDAAERDWYAAAAAEHGWSRNVLLNQIMGRVHERIGAAPSNFEARLPSPDSELAQQLTRDPYILDFLDLTEPIAERDLEAALMRHLQKFLLELGHGFAFVGRQWRFDVDGQEFRIDLLFFHIPQARYVVIELKIGHFQPEYTGKLGFYVAWVDENLRDHDNHSPTLGVLLCTSRNDNIVRYSLAGNNQPLAVADYTYDALPRSIREALPTEAELSNAAGEALDQLREHPSLGTDDGEALNP